MRSMPFGSAERQRQRGADRRDRRHENRPQARGPRFKQRIAHRQSPLSLLPAFCLLPENIAAMHEPGVWLKQFRHGDELIPARAQDMDDDGQGLHRSAQNFVRIARTVLEHDCPGADG